MSGQSEVSCLLSKTKLVRLMKYRPGFGRILRTHGIVLVQLTAAQSATHGLHRIWATETYLTATYDPRRYFASKASPCLNGNRRVSTYGTKLRRSSQGRVQQHTVVLFLSRQPDFDLLSRRYHIDGLRDVTDRIPWQWS